MENFIRHNFYPNNELTYIKSPHYEKNPFISRSPEQGTLPTYEGSKHLLPKPYWQGHDDTISCHDKAWQIAFRNLRMPKETSGFVSAFIDTAFNGYLFLWDSSFIMMFGRYASRAFNFQKTLDNFYARQHKDGFICRELRETGPGEHFTRHDPSSTGPAILSWTEWEYYKTTADKERLSDVYYPLLAYHEWMKENHTWRDGTYWSTGWGCGMDNQPRVEPGRHEAFSHAHMVWVDACLQAILDARTLIRMATELGHEEDISVLQTEIDHLTNVVNNRLWSETDAFYYDEWRDGRLNGVKSVAAYWALLAEIVPPERLERFVAHLDNEKEFKRPNRVPTLSADHPDYCPEGGYWCGSVWAPTNYMIMKGLEATGYDQLAHEIASAFVDHVTQVYQDTETVWENYAPETPAPGLGAGRLASKDFVGWTGLAPIAVLYEYVMGIKGDPVHTKIRWDVRLTEAHGIVDYPFGDCTVSLHCDTRISADNEPKVHAETTSPLQIDVFWGDGQSKTLLFNM